MPLTEFGGIDVLGNIMESSLLSINRNFYGDMHNMGHVAIALCHDPDNRFLVSPSVITQSLVISHYTGGKEMIVLTFDRYSFPNRVALQTHQQKRELVCAWIHKATISPGVILL